MIARLLTPFALLLLGITASCSNTLDPYPSAVFVVDTDMAVPRFVDRVRVDTYASDGTWMDSHDYAILNARDWPVSFGIYSTDDTKERTLYVRLRGYTAARRRDYHGERYLDASGVRPGMLPPKANQQLPRLIVGGKDVTPADEPEPMTTIDRLVEVVLRPGKTGAINILLSGECMGTMARTSFAGSYSPFVPAEAGTCIDKSNVRVAMVESPLAERATGPTRQGTWQPTTACTATGPGTTCVPGGAFFIGSPQSLGWGLSSVPQRVVGLSPFRVDSNEVTVGAWRAAVTGGLVSPDSTPWPYEAAFPSAPVPNFVGCTYSNAPMSREDFPINCVTFAAARTFCKSKGGDIPTEAQWEYLASAVGRPAETPYPWGSGDYPDCKKSVHSRSYGSLPGLSACNASGFGPQPVTTAIASGNDVNPLGVMNLAGSVGEWTLDTPASYDDPCWLETGMKDTKCVVEGEPHVVRGSYWNTEQTVVSNRLAPDYLGYYDSSLGFRCAYPVIP
ncbi:hypothetical protein BH09MYX1_BH09MYX1_37880 [soil metagenome]